MNNAKIFLFLITLIPGISLANQQSKDFTDFTFSRLPHNYQEILTTPHGKFDFGSGIAPYFAFKIANMDISKSFEISTLVKDKKVFYPFVLLLNDEKQLERVVKTRILLETKSMSRVSSKHSFDVDTTIKYIIITTDPDLYGKNIRYNSQYSNTMPIQSGSTTIYIPGPSMTLSNNVSFSEQTTIEILTPTIEDTKPFRRQDGFYFDIGVNFGSEKVADNPDGDSYNVGGGAVFGLGYSYLIPKTSSLSLKSFAGIRYQGGKGNNQGIVFQSNVVKEFSSVNLGIGLYADINNKITDVEGSVTEFQDALGYQLILEWRAADFFNFGLKYIDINYKTISGEVYKGGHVAVSLISYF